MDTDTDNDRLDGRIKALRAEMAGVDAPRGVEKELMDAFAKQHARKRWHQKLPRLRWALAGAGSIAALAAVFMLPLNSPVTSTGIGPQLVQRDERGFFIALESLERIEQEANPHMIETEVPRMELAALGVSLTPENAGESVLAEMLVSADGQPLALRLSAIQ